MNNSAVGRSWEELEKEIYTPEEIAASDLRVALINELIKAKANELRAKKGYEVKGDGANREYISLNNKNSKS